MKMRPSNRLIAGLAALGLIVCCFGAEASDLRVAIHGVRSSSWFWATAGKAARSSLMMASSHLRSVLEGSGNAGLHKTAVVGGGLRSYSFCLLYPRGVTAGASPVTSAVSSGCLFPAQRLEIMQPVRAE